MSRILLLANDWPGVQVARILRQSGDQIVRLYLHEPATQKLAGELVDAAGVAPDRVYTASVLAQPEHVAQLRQLEFDWIVTVYWAHLLKPGVFRQARSGTVNFHPAPLPVNRGWFPHVHSILDGSPIGVTLHQIEEDADTGPIWAQDILTLRPEESAKDVYDRLQTRIVDLFAEKWPAIRDGKVTPQPQQGAGCYHKKKEIEGLDRLELDRATTGRAVINQLRARSFGSRSFAYFDENGERYYVRVQINKTGKFT